MQIDFTKEELILIKEIHNVLGAVIRSNKKLEELYDHVSQSIWDKLDNLGIEDINDSEVSFEKIFDRYENIEHLKERAIKQLQKISKDLAKI